MWEMVGAGARHVGERRRRREEVARGQGHEGDTGGVILAMGWQEGDKM